MFSKITAILVMRLPVFPRELVTCAIVFQLCRSWTEKADFVAYNKLTTGLRHDLGIFARISKFRCFHETKQTQNEVERFFLQLGRICFRILLRQSENFSEFRRVLQSFVSIRFSQHDHTVLHVIQSARAQAPLHLPHKFF